MTVWKFPYLIVASGSATLHVPAGAPGPCVDSGECRQDPLTPSPRGLQGFPRSRRWRLPHLCPGWQVALTGSTEELGRQVAVVRLPEPGYKSAFAGEKLEPPQTCRTWWGAQPRAGREASHGVRRRERVSIQTPHDRKVPASHVGFCPFLSLSPTAGRPRHGGPLPGRGMGPVPRTRGASLYPMLPATWSCFCKCDFA